MENIKLVANKLNLNEEDLFCYGNYKAKIENINTNVAKIVTTPVNNCVNPINNPSAN